MTYKSRKLPHQTSKIFLTDGGLETTLLFLHGIELPQFAAFHLLRDIAGRNQIQNYYRDYASLAKRQRTDFLLESCTWRASKKWGDLLGYNDQALKAANLEAIALLHELRDEYETPESSFVISGCIGPESDGYQPGCWLNAVEAENYHRTQIDWLVEADVDMITALTITYIEEAIGIVRAARAAKRPVAIGFTVELDGNLPSAVSLQQAIETVDRETAGGPAYYLINCAHPSHFSNKLKSRENWTRRIRGLRANASCASHAELDEAEELDAGDVQDLSNRYRDIHTLMPWINLLGGCCGTSYEHVEAICGKCNVGRKGEAA